MYLLVVAASVVGGVLILFSGRQGLAQGAGEPADHASAEERELFRLREDIAWGLEEIRGRDLEPHELRDQFREFERLNWETIEREEELSRMIAARAERPVAPVAVPREGLSPTQVRALDLRIDIGRAMEEIAGSTDDPVERRELMRELRGDFETVEELEDSEAREELEPLQLVAESRDYPETEEARQWQGVRTTLGARRAVHARRLAGEDDPVARRDLMRAFENSIADEVEREEELARAVIRQSADLQGGDTREENPEPTRE